MEAPTSTGSFGSCRMDKPLFWRVDLPEAPFVSAGWLERAILGLDSWNFCGDGLMGSDG